MNPNSAFELSRIFARGWNVAKALPVSVSSELSSAEIGKLNPHEIEAERLRWSEGFAQALCEGPPPTKRHKASASHKLAPRRKKEGKIAKIYDERRQMGKSQRFSSDNQQSQFSAGRGQQNSATGDWQRSYNRYCELARSPGSGDAVAREQYWQHAEHFYRLMNGTATL